jgi:hypothetical protein
MDIYLCLLTLPRRYPSKAKVARAIPSVSVPVGADDRAELLASFEDLIKVKRRALILSYPISLSVSRQQHASARSSSPHLTVAMQHKKLLLQCSPSGHTARYHVHSAGEKAMPMPTAASSTTTSSIGAEDEEDEDDLSCSYLQQVPHLVVTRQ